jgi:hypothetical protein
MKRLKLPLIIVGSLLAVVVIVVILAFTSGVQTWATRKALAGQPGMKGAVGSVSAGLKSAEIRDVRIEQDGIIIVAKQLDAGYSASDYLSGKKIIVDHVTARGVEIDARNPAAKAGGTPPPAAVALAPFAGVLNAIRLPGETRLGRVDVDAKVLLPNNQSATFTLEGGGLAPGQFATLKWKATFADATPGAPLVSAQASGEMKVRTTADLRIDAVEITGEATAVGPGIPADRLKLEINLTQPAANAAETALAKIFLIRAGGPGTPEPLFDAKVDYAAGKPVMNGAWNLTVRSEQLAAVLAGFGLPEVALNGKGSFSYNLDTGAATAAGELDGEVSKLEKLGAELGAIGALKLHAAFDGGSSTDSAQLGKLTFDVAAADGRKLVAVAAQQKLSFAFKDKKITAERPGAELLRIALTNVPLAWAQPVVKPRVVSSGDLSAVFVVGAELDGSRVKLTAAEPLTIRTFTLREGDKPLVDRLSLSVSPSVDYTAARIIASLDKLSISTPDGDTVSGSLGADVAMPAAGSTAKPVTSFTAELKGKLVTLVKPYLPPEVGPLTLAVSAKGKHDGASVQLAALSTKIDREGGVLLGSVEALQPLTIDLAKLQPSVPNATAPALRVKWGTIPLAWAQSYVEKSKLSGDLTAGAIEVAMLGVDALSVRALEPIALRGMNVAMDGQEFLRGADFSTDLSATWKGGAVTADMKRLELRQGAKSVLTASFAIEATPGKKPETAWSTGLQAKGRGQLDADFSVLAEQPALAAQLPLTKGTVSIKFDGTKAGGTQGKASVSIKNLVGRQGTAPLGSMEITAEANLDATNSGTIRNQLVVTKDNRRSDLLLDGKVGFKPGEKSFDGKITSEQIFVDDMQAFAVLAEPAPGSPAATAATAPAPAPRPAASATPASRPGTTTAATARPAVPKKDTEAVWNGFAGHVELNAKSIKQGTTVTVKDLHGVVTIAHDRLAADGLSFELNGNSFKASSIITFEAKQERPYSLVGFFDVPKFDVGEYFRRADPSQPPMAETIITIASKFNGTAATLPEFADRVMGQFDLKGSKGVLRALNKQVAKVDTGAKIVSGLAGLAGAFLKNEKDQALANKVAGNAAGLAELAEKLKDMPFDSIAIQADRGADAAIVIRHVEILSPELRLTANGRVDTKPGVEIAESPLSLQAQLAGKGTIAVALDKVGMLAGKKDDKDYYLTHTPFTMGGTVGKTTNNFWTIVGNSASNVLSR